MVVAAAPQIMRTKAFGGVAEERPTGWKSPYIWCAICGVTVSVTFLPGKLLLKQMRKPRKIKCRDTGVAR
jgi:hypothetical protein